MRTLSGESDKFSCGVLSLEPPIPPDDYVLLGRKDLLLSDSAHQQDLLSDSAHQQSSKFINGISEIISAWEERGFLRFVA